MLGSEMTDELMKVGGVAKRTNRSIRALRHYEEHGLLQPAARTDGGTRLYAADAIERITWIEQLQTMGLSLADVGQILELANSDAPAPRTMQEIRDLLGARVDETRKRLDELLALERDLTDTVTYLLECRTCDETRSASRVCATCEHRNPRRHDKTAPGLIKGMQSTPQRDKP